MSRGRPGSLRIVAGGLRGRRIRVPPGLQVRPTPERVREALFSILQPVLPESEVLEAYAGSGALGFEALSRGAHRVTFVEADAGALASLRRNAAGLGLISRCRILAGRVETLLDEIVRLGPYDLVLADPPYEDATGGRFLAGLASSGALRPAATVVFQRDRRTPPAGDAEGGLTRVRTARYGRTCLDFYTAPAPRNP